jgi:RNA polymerase sigma factor (sigma-70 family)
MDDGAARRAIEAVFRIERARLVGGLARLTRDVGVAEELAQDALLLALAEWPRAGVPDRPGAWLMAVARRRALDGLRRRRMLDRSHAEIRHARDAAHDATESLDAALDDDLGDEVLGLLFAACHPLLPREARAALTLRLVAGLTTAEIARAFLAKDATIAQRITRAKRLLAETAPRFEVPRGAALAPRLEAVLEAIYLLFNEGYAATEGEDLTRPALCEEAQRLGRILAARMPEAPEVQGLLALMELQASRLAARIAPGGASVPLPEQDRARWDRLLVRRGLAALARAEALGGAEGPYALQAALAACHARARRWAETDWPRIAGLYDRLLRVQATPVVALNRAVAHGMAFGPEAALALLAQLEAEPALAFYAPMPAAKGDALARAGRAAEAQIAFQAAAALSRNARERDFLLARARDCDQARIQATTPR